MSGIALIALNLQNQIVHPDGEIGKSGIAAQVASRQVLANAKRVIEGARAAGAPVIHIGLGGLRGQPGTASSAPFLQTTIAGMLQGSWAATFEESVAPGTGEEVLYHTGILPFRGTALLRLLDDYRIRKVMILGVDTRLMVQAAVFEASDSGYETILVEDCCAASTPQLHTRAMNTLQWFATVANSTQALDLLTQPR